MKYCNSQNIDNAYLATHSLCVSLSSNRGAWGMWLAQFFFHFIIDNIYLKPSIHVCMAVFIRMLVIAHATCCA